MSRFGSFFKLPGGGETQRCFYPLKLDTYGCGCSNDCLYCYARSVLSFRNLWDADDQRRTIYGEISKIFNDVFMRGKKTKWAPYLRRRLPIRIGGMTDCFSETERENGQTLEVLHLMKSYRYPYLILTKNSLVAEPKYLAALDPELAYVQFSVTTLHEDVAAVFEPGGDPPRERLRAAAILSNAGFHTAMRINPLFPLYPDGHYSGTTTDREPLRYFAWDLIDAAAEHDFRTVIAGFLRLAPANLRWIKERSGINMRPYFGKQFKNQALHYSAAEKQYYYERLKGMYDALDLRFSVCYDGDEDYETFRYLWANPDDCCDGLGNVAAFGTVHGAFPKAG